jgi:hypothetical protein
LRPRRQAFGIAQHLHGARADPGAAAHGVGHAAAFEQALTTPAAKPSPAPTVSITSFTAKPSTRPVPATSLS